MTPVEKAIELVHKFSDQPINFPYIDTQDGQCIGSGYMTYISAKYCALIAVDEVLNFIEDDREIFSWKEYWQEVKQEIEKI